MYGLTAATSLRLLASVNSLSNFISSSATFCPRLFLPPLPCPRATDEAMSNRAAEISASLTCPPHCPLKLSECPPGRGRPNAARHAPASSIENLESHRVAGRVHALVMRRMGEVHSP